MKYNQLKCVNTLFKDLSAQPLLLNYFRDRGFRVVHLVRKNLLHQAISMIVANQRNIWCNCDRSTLEGRYHLPIQQLIEYMDWVQIERAAFERLSGELPAHVCAYEDVVEDIRNIDGHGCFRKNAKVMGELADFLHVSNRFNYSQCRPKVLNRPYSEFIENYDEVVRAVADSKFSEFAGSI